MHWATVAYSAVAGVDVVSAVFVRAQLDTAVIIGKNIVVSVLCSVERKVGHIR